jgi:hypothetical protein
MKVFVILLVIGARGIVNKGLKISGSNTRNYSIDYLHKTAVLRTQRVTRKLLQSWSLMGGVHHWFKRRSTRESPCDNRR